MLFYPATPNARFVGMPKIIDLYTMSPIGVYTFNRYTQLPTRQIIGPERPALLTRGDHAATTAMERRTGTTEDIRRQDLSDV